MKCTGLLEHIIVESVDVDDLPTALVTHSTPPCPSVPALLSTLLASIFVGLLPFNPLSKILLLLLLPFPLLTLLLLPLVRSSSKSWYSLCTILVLVLVQYLQCSLKHILMGLVCIYYEHYMLGHQLTYISWTHYEQTLMGH